MKIRKTEKMKNQNEMKTRWTRKSLRPLSWTTRDGSTNRKWNKTIKTNPNNAQKLQKKKTKNSSKTKNKENNNIMTECRNANCSNTFWCFHVRFCVFHFSLLFILFFCLSFSEFVSICSHRVSSVSVFRIGRSIRVFISIISGG